MRSLALLAQIAALGAVASPPGASLPHVCATAAMVAIVFGALWGIASAYSAAGGWIAGHLFVIVTTPRRN